MPGPYLNVGLFQTAVSDNDTTQKEELGVWRFSGGKVYKYTKSGALIPRGEPCRYDFTVTTAALIGNQILQSSAVTDIFAGVAEATFASLSFGWLTVYGPATGRVDTNVIPGSPLGPSSTTGVLTIRNTSHFNAVAVALETGLSAGSAIFISVL